jgi:hypothetical protein
MAFHPKDGRRAKPTTNRLGEKPERFAGDVLNDNDTHDE